MTAPIAVEFIETASELDDLIDGGRHTAAQLFFTTDGVLSGQAELDFRDGRISAARLREAMATSAPAGDPKRHGVPADCPSATVAVPTLFARGPALDRTLATLIAQDHPDYEILVVDNRAAPAQDPEQHDELTGRDPRIRVLSQPRPGASAARNLALAEAKGELIAYTDDDAAADPRWLSGLARRLAATPEADCVTGSVLPAELATQAQIWFERSGSGPNRRFTPALFQRVPGRRFQVRDVWSDAPPHSLYALGDLGAGANMAFRVEALRALGGFDEALGPGSLTAFGGEDILVFLRVLASGRGLAVEPAAYVRHWHRRTYAELQAQIHGYGRAFTAMLAAAVIDDPRHLLGLAGVLAPGALSLLGIGSEKTAQRPSDYPAELHRLELRGMLAGPPTYLRSRRRARVYRRAG